MYPLEISSNFHLAAQCYNTEIAFSYFTLHTYKKKYNLYTVLDEKMIHFFDDNFGPVSYASKLKTALDLAVLLPL
jgi:hypothetical protein